VGFAGLLAFDLAAGCDMAGPRRGPAEKASSGAPPTAVSAESPAPVSDVRPASEVKPALEAKPAPGRCVVPRVEPPPAPATPAARCPPDPVGPLDLPRGAVQFTDAPSAPKIVVERALDDAARARGLMYRTQLDADAGMLFSWKEEEPRSFWMLNTCIPLDMLFIAADGTIVGILEHVPTLNTLPRAIPCAAAHVLEVNAGWTRQHGVVPGQKVDIES
jgi:uncharacterized membrane protein (UPF0127 family)